MEKKFNIILKALNILMVFITLNGCNHGIHGVNGVNGVNTGTSGTATNSPRGRSHMKGNYKKRVCPNCEGGCRYLYKLSNNVIVLMCEECNAIWTDQQDIGWGKAVSDKTLEKRFGVNDVEELFDEAKSGWATKEEARGWNNSFVKRH